LFLVRLHKLRTYFSTQFGFVKHEYVSIDSSELVIELKEIRKT